MGLAGSVEMRAPSNRSLEFSSWPGKLWAWNQIFSASPLHEPANIGQKPKPNMASQTIQDVKAIYAAAKAKLDSLPDGRKHEVLQVLMQWIMAVSVALVVVFAILGFQVYLHHKEAEAAWQDLSQYRWRSEHYFKETQRLQKELDSKKP